MPDDGAAAVLRVVCAARSIASDPWLAAELARTTGLSPANVARALAHHLELDPTAEEIAALVRAAGRAPEVAVVLSANVFVGALRAIALARAAAPRVRVRPSRREPAFARALVLAMRALGDDSVELAPSLVAADVLAGELHVYGHDRTIADIRAKAPPGVRVRGHGSGLGVAWVTRTASLDAAAKAIAEDVVVFDQQGCLSPRVAIVEGEIGRAADLGRALHAALEVAEREVPRGAVPEDVRASAAMWSASLAYAGEVLEADAHVVGIVDDAIATAIPPSHRHVLVVASRDAASARRALSPLARAVVAFGCDDPSAAKSVAPHGARLSRLGAMQRPRLDGPVDRREG
jgi:hypothetical protein